ncbi:helix-turn-helix domain-containing protein [Priestia megaterium]|uniref:helix-turn-helix domain-containing protein n=1 Tax=Priestia megaterium TaxID=1404 RepID=UPI001E2E726C|nr:helix-turn-helix domain-containing protein [Priestia megaterium]MCE4093388.1 helix-turn-helix domain-containing protein [Priestia megaterium]
MTVSRIVTHEEFIHMTNYQSYAERAHQKKEMKKILLEKVMKTYGDTFYRLKEGTRKAIDMLCFFATERGFVYASDQYLADRYKVSDRTIRNILAMLRKKGLIITVYRGLSNHNGRGCPMHLFVEHPYFEYWTSYLNLENFQADFQTEHTEIPCGSKNSEVEKKPTFYLTFNSLNKIRTESVHLSAEFTPSIVPEDFKNTVSVFFNDAKEIHDIWKKACLANKISGLNVPSEDIMPVILQAFKEAIYALKQNKIKKDFQGYFFGTLRGMLALEARRKHFNPEHPLYYNFLEA